MIDPTNLPEQGVFIIKYDDYSVEDEFIVGRDIALKRYEMISWNWNAHLFVKIDSNSRDEKSPNATF